MPRGYGWKNGSAPGSTIGTRTTERDAWRPQVSASRGPNVRDTSSFPACSDRLRQNRWSGARAPGVWRDGAQADLSPWRTGGGWRGPRRGGCDIECRPTPLTGDGPEPHGSRRVSVVSGARLAGGLRSGSDPNLLGAHPSQWRGGPVGPRVCHGGRRVGMHSASQRHRKPVAIP